MTGPISTIAPRAATHAVATALIGMLLLYRIAISPLLRPACRFYPSCSRYAIGAIEAHGPWTGTLLAVRRLLRCHPFGGSGVDPVPLRRRG